MKVCNHCHIDKELSEFSLDTRRKDGYRGYCKECAKVWSIPYNKIACEKAKEYRRVHRAEIAEKMKDYYIAHRAERKEHDTSMQLKRKYGISLEDYREFHKRQGGVCGICGMPEQTIDPRTNKTLNLPVDHDHETGIVRGLLCSNCNRGLGMYKNNPALLRKAADYLEGLF